jgi:hypothetical protein
MDGIIIPLQLAWLDCPSSLTQLPVVKFSDNLPVITISPTFYKYNAYYLHCAVLCILVFHHLTSLPSIYMLIAAGNATLDHLNATLEHR